MAWYNRVARAAGNFARRVGRAITGPQAGPPPTVEEPLPPAPPPRPVTQGTYEPPYQPVTPPAPYTPEAEMGLPAEAPMQPSDTGFWQPQEEPTIPELRGDEFTMYDPMTFDPIPTDYVMTQGDWYREALMPADYLRSRYDWADKNIQRPNIEILLQLEADGYFIDWDQWRETYEAAMGV